MWWSGLISKRDAARLTRVPRQWERVAGVATSISGTVVIASMRVLVPDPANVPKLLLSSYTVTPMPEPSMTIVEYALPKMM